MYNLQLKIKNIIHSKLYILHSSKGQSLIEILVAIALAMVILPAVLTGVVASRENKAQGGQRIQAIAYLKEMEEAVRSVREKGWSNIATNGIYYPVAGSSWSLGSGTQTLDAASGMTRQLTISSVNRDSSGNIAGSGTLDPSTKKVDYAVSWSLPNPGTVTSGEYLLRYVGNSTKVQTTQADFDAGVKTNTRSTSTGGGTIELTPLSPVSGNFTDDYTTAANYNYDSSKIEVTGGYAQLKNIGSPVSGQTTNSGFDSNANNWAFASYGDNISQAGSWQGSGGNPGGYIRINLPKSNSKRSGGYYNQGFTTTASNPTGTLTFQWRVTAYQATPTSFHLYAWIDSSATGTPTVQVWDSGNITGTTSWSGTVTVNVASYITTPGTYYLKVGGFVDTSSGNKGPYAFGYDNVLLSWSGSTTSYAADSPTIYPKNSFTAASITAWTSFTATEVPNGGSVRYQLSDDNGATWKYWNGSAWAAVSLPTNYNDAATINTRIGTFPIINRQILVKTFLISNGTQFVRLDKIVIGYTGTPSGPNSGTFTSSSLDGGANVGFNNLAWTESNTVSTTTKFQIAANSDNTTWNYTGPDGTNGTYFTNGFGTIPLTLVSARYLRYQISFNSTNSDIPSVSDVTVNYSP